LKKSIRDLDLKNRRVFIRDDFNVPLKNGVIRDDTRIRASLPTIKYARDAGAKCVVLASHLGRPKGRPNPEMSLRPVADRLTELLGVPVAFAGDCVGPEAEDAVRNAPPGGVVLLENLRFHPEEEKNEIGFAGALASLADAYVNDAFGAAHRAHASVEAIVRLMPQAAAGLLMENELRYLGDVLEKPQRPFVAVLGGAKVSDKIEVIENLIPRVDRLLIGGAMAYTFSLAQGGKIGKSYVVEKDVPLAKELLGTGVLVNCVAPVMVETELFKEMTQQHIDYCRSLIPMGRFLEVDEVAAMVAWIAGPECSFTTGAVFDLSGGRATY